MSTLKDTLPETLPFRILIPKCYTELSFPVGKFRHAIYFLTRVVNSLTFSIKQSSTSQVDVPHTAAKSTNEDKGF